MAASDPGTGRRLALVTCRSLAEPTPDERLLEPLLREQGWSVAHLAWDQTEVPWSDLGGVVVRSTWDYSERPDEFRAWLDRLDAAGVKVWNPVPLLRWNLDKRYLEDLEERGVPVVPTGWIDQGGLVHLHHVLEFEGWEEAVVKPVISAGAANTWAVDRASARDKDMDFRKLVATRPMMVQELYPEVRTGGELSFCFFNGRFSHAVKKLPAGQDFRVQEHLGGRTEAYQPETELVDQAHRVLEAIEGDWLYARVDGVVRRGRLVLMELELLEPTLYLTHAAEAAERFAAAIVSRLG